VIPEQKSGFSNAQNDQKVTSSAPLEDYVESASLPPAYDHKPSREKRYKIQSIAQELLLKKARKLGLEQPFNFHKTTKCKRIRVASEVSVNKANTKAFYGGLSTCNNPWACPVCSSVIQEKRRQENAKAVDWAYDELKGKAIMLTFTFPHGLKDKLKASLDKQKQAFRLLRGGKVWDKHKTKIGFEGLIRSLEVVHGVNGWHPHTHELWFTSKDVDAEALKQFVLNRWWNICLKVGLVVETDKSAFLKHAVDVKDNASNSDYLAKHDGERYWGADREVAKGNAKNKGKGRHPFELLEAYDDLGDERSGKLFLEYAEAIKGKAQVFWSHGLKAKVGIEDVSDEEIEEGDSNSKSAWEVLGFLDRDQWDVVLLNRLRSKVLDVAEKDGFHAVLKLLEDTVQANLDFFNNTS